LFYAADATILPYTVTSSSGVMFDGLVHGLPFVATDLDFFKEFSSKGLGITVKRKPDAFANGLVTLGKEDFYRFCHYVAITLTIYFTESHKIN
jgi:hypothetical protein